MTIKRTKPLPRSTKRIARYVRVKPINRQRKARRFVKSYGSHARVAWTKTQPCAVQRGVRAADRVCAGEIDSAHIKRDGGVKAGPELVVPLCRRHHQILDEAFGDYELFGEAYGIDMAKAAADLERDWQAHMDRSS